jgi:hypothetical protein
MLGDTIDVVEKHYAPFVTELRERVRLILETGVGIEKPLHSATQIPLNESRKPN